MYSRDRCSTIGAKNDIDIMLQSCDIEFDWWFQGGLLEAPLYPLKPGVSRGPPGLSGGPGPLGPPRNSTTGSESTSVNGGSQAASRLSRIRFTYIYTVHTYEIYNALHSRGWLESEARAVARWRGLGRKGREVECF